MTAVTKRKPIYLVESYFGPALGRAYVETDESPRFTRLDDLVRDIAHDQFGEVTSIHLVDFVAGTVCDVTNEVMYLAEGKREAAR